MSLGKGEHTIHKKWRENQTNEVYMQLNARNKRRRKHFATKRFLYAHFASDEAACSAEGGISPRGTGRGKKVPSTATGEEMYSVLCFNM